MTLDMIGTVAIWILATVGAIAIIAAILVWIAVGRYDEWD